MKGKAVLILAVLALAAAPKRAAAGGYPLQTGGDTWATIGFRLQVDGGMYEGQAGAANGDSTRGGTHYDVYVRRAQIAVAGQIAPTFSFDLTLEHNDLGKNRSAGSGLMPLDAYIAWDFSAAMRLVAGIFPPPFSRNRLTQSFSLIGMDRPVMENLLPDAGPLLDKRDRGLMLMGNLGTFQYRYAMTAGAVPRELGVEPLRTTWRIQLSTADPETDVFMKETYLGEKQVLSIGYGADSQTKISLDPAGQPADYRASTWDIAIEGGKGMTLHYAHYQYNWGNAERTGQDGLFTQGTGWTATIAYLNPDSIDPKKGVAGVMQPYLRQTSWTADSDSPTAKQTRTALGMALYLKGHDAKVIFEYEKVGYSKDGPTPDMRGHANYSMQWQTAF